MNRLDMILFVKNKDNEAIAVIKNHQSKIEVWVFRDEDWHIIKITETMHEAMDAINQGGEVYDAA